MKKSTPVLAAALLQLPLAAFAQSAVTAVGAPTLNETVVTANRTPQPLSELVGDVSVIDRDQIERAGAVGVADLLARQPGIEITRTGGVGNTTSLYIRGAETRFTAVYIDGVRIDSQSTGGATWETIPLSQIDRIEVLRGPAAAVYGSDAIGGVVQLFTRRGEGGVSPTVGIGFGSHGLRRADVGVSGTAGEGNVFDYSIGATHEESKGYNIQPLDKRVPTRTAQYAADGYTSGDRDGYRTDSGNVKLGYQFTPNQRVEATVLFSEQQAQYDTAKFVTRPPTSYPNDIGYQRLRTAGLAWNAKWSDFYSTRVQVTDSASNYENAAELLPHRDQAARLSVPERIPLRCQPGHRHARAP